MVAYLRSWLYPAVKAVYNNRVNSNPVVKKVKDIDSTATNVTNGLVNSVDWKNIASFAGSTLSKALTTSALKQEQQSVKDFQKWSEEQNNLAWERSESSAQKQMRFQKAQSDLAWQRSESSAQKQMDFQKEMFQKEMDYNERMSSTAYQRAVADLRKAGLNPVLAVSQGSASSPSASAPSGAMSSAQAMSGAMASANTPQNVKGDYTSAKQADLYALNLGLGFFNNMLSSAVKLIDSVIPF